MILAGDDFYFESSGSITGANQIDSTGTVIADAAAAVILQPGFNAAKGSTFSAFIDGCGGLRVTDETSKDYVAAEADAQLGIFPNPFSGSFRISFTLPAETHMSIQLFDNAGRMVYEMMPAQSVPAGRRTLVFDATGLNQGVYFIHFQMGERRIVEKIVKM
jgi:hypothetical protein